MDNIQMVSLAWIHFFVTVVFSVVLLLVPGFVFLKAFRLGGMRSVVYSPLISVFLFCMVGAVLPPLGDVGAYVVIGTSVGIAFLIHIAAFLFRKKRDGKHFEAPRSSTGYSDYIFSTVVSVVVVGVVFVMSLNGPDSFSQHSDNLAHLGKIKAMVDSGHFSTFSVSSYNAVSDINQVPFEDSSFYPSAWYVICALVGSITNSSPGLAENAVNFIFIALVLPCAMCVLGRAIGRGDWRFSLTCGVFSCIFAMFPIGMFLYSALYPNVASYCCLPLLFVVFFDLVESIAKKKKIILQIVLFFVGSLSIVFLQPNGVFAAIVVLAPYLVYVAPRVFSCHPRFSGFSQGFGAAALRVIIVVFVAAVWVLLNRAPFMQGVVTYNWPAICSIPDAIAGSLTLSLRPGVPQYLLAFFVWTGFAYTLFHRRYFWLSVALLFTLFSYVICAATDGSLKVMLTGFWYNDQWRASATVYFAAVPLASLGVVALVRSLKVLLGAKDGNPVANESVLYVFALISIVFVASFPSYTISGEYKRTALGEAARILTELNGQTEENALTEEEDAFIDRVVNCVGSKSLIINFPYDGSAFGYTKHDINLYYKSYLSTGETKDSELIREGLSYRSDSVEVSSAVDEIDAEYVMLLERNGFVDNGLCQWSPCGPYVPQDWQGVLGVNDSTVGFEVVLSEGDMRLYRIVR